MKTLSMIILVILAGAFRLDADQIKLKDGQVITGQFICFLGNKALIEIKSPVPHNITIPQANLQEIVDDNKCAIYRYEQIMAENLPPNYYPIMTHPFVATRNDTVWLKDGRILKGSISGSQDSILTLENCTPTGQWETHRFFYRDIYQARGQFYHSAYLNQRVFKYPRVTISLIQGGYIMTNLGKVNDRFSLLYQEVNNTLHLEPVDFETSYTGFQPSIAIQYNPRWAFSFSGFYGFMSSASSSGEGPAENMFKMLTVEAAHYREWHRTRPFVSAGFAHLRAGFVDAQKRVLPNGGTLHYITWQDRITGFVFGLGTDSPFGEWTVFTTGLRFYYLPFATTQLTQKVDELHLQASYDDDFNIISLQLLLGLKWFF